MQGIRNRKNVGKVWLCAGVAFLGIAISGQVAFIGVAAAFLMLGTLMLVKARQGAGS